MPLTATRFLRKMRGGAQAHLLAAESGNGSGYFVTKFIDNPQHRRILANEWIAARLLEYLQIASPRVALVDVSSAFLERNPEVCLTLGPKKHAVTPGWHLGSQFPGNPHTEAVYDYLPDALLPQVVNLADFAGVLAFDRWTGNSDARQAIFFRRRIREWLDHPGTPPQQKGFIAQMVDHGYIFDGPHWTLRDAPLQGLYPRAVVYAGVRTLDDFQPWLDRIRSFPESVIDETWRRIPPAWIEGEEDLLESLLLHLLERKRRVAELIQSTIEARPQVFPNWRTLK